MDFSIIRKVIRDCFRIDRQSYPEAKVLTIAHDNDRSLLYNSKWYSPIIDTLEDDLRQYDIECISVARIISRIKGDLSYGKAFSPEGAFARAFIVKRLQSLWRTNRYPYSTMEEAIWGKIIDESKVQHVIAIQPSRELCVACHKRNVWVADIQHGVIADAHPWYGQSFRSQDPLEQLPHAFICWDKGSSSVIEKWAKTKGIDTFVIGNRWVRRFQYPQFQDPLVKTLQEKFDAGGLNPEQKPAILLALSWGEVNIPNGFMVDDVLHTIQHTSNKYKWFIRLHPNQIKGFATHEGIQFTKFFEKNLKCHAENYFATHTALPLLLNHVDIVLTWNSSVCIEAAQMGIKTALLDPRLRVNSKLEDYYFYYKQKGLIDLLEASEEKITSWIAYNITSRKQKENFFEYDTEYERLMRILAKNRSDYNVKISKT